MSVLRAISCQSSKPVPVSHQSRVLSILRASTQSSEPVSHRSSQPISASPQSQCPAGSQSQYLSLLRTIILPVLRAGTRQCSEQLCCQSSGLVPVKPQNQYLQSSAPLSCHFSEPVSDSPPSQSPASPQNQYLPVLRASACQLSEPVSSQFLEQYL